MTLDALIMLAGAFVALIPFLGFPGSWDTILYVLLGVLVIGLGIVVRNRTVSESETPDSYVEHGIEEALHENN